MSSLWGLIQTLSSENFMPHGYCYHWIPSLVWLHVASDGMIALAYMMIPFTLLYFVKKRNDLAYPWMFLCFGAFIVSCSMTHIMNIWTLWFANYWVSGVIKAITAIISFITAVLLIVLVPAALRIPSKKMLTKVNRDLELATLKLADIFEGAPDAMILVKANGEIDNVNAQTERLFGYERGELLNKPVEKLIPDRFKRNHMDHRSGYFNNPHPRPMGAGLELYGKRKDGTEFPLEISLSPVVTGGNSYAMAAVRDITRKKEIESELVTKNLELVNANAAKDQFLSHMSHELRTPLNGIISMTQLLQSSELTDRQRTELKVIADSNRQLLSVINSILDFSKVESGHVGIESIPFNPREMIEDVILPYKIKAGQKQLEFNCDIHPSIPEQCHGDVMKIRQVLTNILDNAVKFTERGSICFKAAKNQSTPNRSDIVFQVIDTGIGISPEATKKLFKPFSQGDSSTTRKYGGTGLGLVISKKLVELMGGVITVDGHANGVKVTFIIPCANQEPAHEDIVIERTNVIVDKCVDSCRILLVEDNEINQKALTLLLESMGDKVSVDLAGNGLDALKRMSVNEYDIVLMDCQMPQLDGYETTRRIRKMEESAGNGHVVIIGVTAHAFEGHRKKCMEAGMDDFVAKPYDNDKLIAMINEYMSKDES